MYFMISLSLTIRFISDIMSELTHTSQNHVNIQPSSRYGHPYSLCGSTSRSCNLNCSHSVLKRCDHLQSHESQTL